MGLCLSGILYALFLEYVVSVSDIKIVAEDSDGR